MGSWLARWEYPALVLAALLFVVHVQFAERIRTALSTEIAVADIRHEGGHQYYAPLPDPALSSHERPIAAELCEGEVRRRPALAALEPLIGSTRAYYVLSHRIAARFGDSSLLTPYVIHWTCRSEGGNALHRDIAERGEGRFSVWRGYLRFSASDNTDPRRNGRHYSLRLPTAAPQIVATAVGFAPWLAGAFWVAIVLWNRGLPLVRRLYARNRVFRNTVPGVAITVGLLAVLFLAAEVYFRIAIPFHERLLPLRTDPVAGLIFDPNATVRYTDHINFWTESRSNSLGFLDREPVLPKPPGRTRILIVGDSFVEAAQVRIEAKFPALLEASLQRKLGHNAVDVVAMGMNGTGQANQLGFYDAFGRLIEPDLVILLVVNNDFANNSALLEAVRYGWDPGHPPRPFFGTGETLGDLHRIAVDPEWLAHWRSEPAGLSEKERYALRLARLRETPRYAELLSGWEYPEDFHMDEMFYVEKMPPAFEAAVALTAHAFAQWKSLAERDGFQLLAVATEGIAPDTPEWYSPNRRVARSNVLLRRLGEIAHRSGIPLFDLKPVFQRYGALEDAVFKYDGHWNETGHRWAAQALAEFLEGSYALLERADAPGAAGP